MSNQTQKSSPARLLITLIVAIAALATGYIAGKNSSSVPTAESNQDAEPSNTAAASSTDELKEQLAAVGYAAGSVSAPARTGVTVNTPAAYSANNLFTSGHFPGAQLMTMDGKILHQWEYSFDQLWPGHDKKESDVSFWRRVHLFPNGDIIAIIEPIGIFKLDRNSKLLWKNDCGAHHDFFVAPNGHTFTLARKSTRRTVVGLERPVLEDFVLELDESGQEVRRVSILDALDASDYRPLLFDAVQTWDITHTNSLKNLASAPDAPPTQVLLSLRELDSAAILDLDSKRITWAFKGMWHRQHEITALDSDRLLLFDNLSREPNSRVVEFDRRTQTIAWTYGDKPGQPLNSPTCGLAARLPNGNTLITESIPGRVLEVTPTGKIVWEFVNPNQLKSKASVIASIFDFQRLPQNFPTDWLPPTQ